MYEAARTVVLPAQQKPAGRSWVKRHPVWTGTIAGFTAGYLIGYLHGEDPSLERLTAGIKGTVLGVVGAGIGALAGWITAR